MYSTFVDGNDVGHVVRNLILSLMIGTELNLIIAHCVPNNAVEDIFLIVSLF